MCLLINNDVWHYMNLVLLFWLVEKVRIWSRYHHWRDDWRLLPNLNALVAVSAGMQALAVQMNSNKILWFLTGGPCCQLLQVVLYNGHKTVVVVVVVAAAAALSGWFTKVLASESNVPVGRVRLWSRNVWCQWVIFTGFHQCFEFLGKCFGIWRVKMPFREQVKNKSQWGNQPIKVHLKTAVKMEMWR